MPQVSAVPHVKGFKFGYVFNFAEESDIKLAVITHYNKGLYIGDYPEGKA